MLMKTKEVKDMWIPPMSTRAAQLVIKIKLDAIIFQEHLEKIWVFSKTKRYVVFFQRKLWITSIKLMLIMMEVAQVALLIVHLEYVHLRALITVQLPISKLFHPPLALVPITQMSISTTLWKFHIQKVKLALSPNFVLKKINLAWKMNKSPWWSPSWKKTSTFNSTITAIGKSKIAKTKDSLTLITAQFRSRPTPTSTRCSIRWASTTSIIIFTSCTRTIMLLQRIRIWNTQISSSLMCLIAFMMLRCHSGPKRRFSLMITAS